MKSLIRLLHIAIFTSALLFAGQCLAESVITTIPSPAPEGVDVNILTRLVYVANFGAPTVSIISEDTNTIVDTITFPPGPLGQAEMNGLAVNPVTSRLYVTDTHNTVLYVVDTQTNQIIDTIPGLSGLMTINPRNNKLYISLFNNGVVVFDGNTNTRITTVNVSFPQRPAINIVTNRVYVPSQGFHGSVAVIDGTTNTLLATIPTGNFTTGVGVDFLRNLAYASNQGFSPSTTNLSVIDTVTNTVVATIPTDTNPAPVAVNPFTNRIYVATTFTAQTVVDIIDGNTRQVINRLPIDPNAAESAIDLLHQLLYITSPNFTSLPGGNVTTVISTRLEPSDE